MLATRLMTILHLVILSNQTGYMPNTATDINIRRVFTHTQSGPEVSSRGILVFLYLEKPLDLSESGFEKDEFGPVFL